MLSIIRRTNRVNHMLRFSFEPVLQSFYHSQQYHLLRTNIRLCSSSGNGFRTLGIAGGNTILRYINDINYNYNYTQKQSFSNKKKSHNPNWNKKYLRNIEYDTNNDIETNSKKSFSFEYLEYLNQKWKSNPSKSKSSSISRNYCSSAGGDGAIFTDSPQQPIASNINLSESPQSPQSPQTLLSQTAETPPNPRTFSSPAAAAQYAQQTMAKEDEINPVSVGGLFVMMIGAAIFWWLFNIDQQKHSEVSSFLSKFTKTRSINDFIVSQTAKAIHRIPDDWNTFQVIFDHFTNFMLSPFYSDRYNSEFIWSKLFRLFYIPSAQLLPRVNASIYTLVIDIDTICHSTWSRNDGFERVIRPHYAEFLRRMAMCGWEVVLFGACEQYDWEESPDIIKLDGKGFVSHYLWNSSAYYFNGHRCKDLKRLNRDLKRVIAIDSDPRSVQLQPKNAIILKKWKNNDDDKNDQSLLKLIEFLEYLAKAEVTDVRQVLAAYRGKDIAEEFRKRYFAAIQGQQQQQQEGYEGDVDDEDDIEYVDDEEEEDEMYQ